MSKLAIKLKDPALAEKLQAAGFTNPSQIREASDKELKAINGIGSATLRDIRAKLPKRG